MLKNVYKICIENAASKLGFSKFLLAFYLYSFFKEMQFLFLFII